MEVAEAAGKVEVVVDPASFDFEARGNDALQLQGVLGLVVVGELDKRAHSAEGGARVSSVGDVEGLAHHQDYVGRAPDRVCHFAVLEGLQAVLNRDVLQQLLSVLRAEQPVQRLKGLLQCLAILSQLKVLIALEHFRQFLGAELRDLDSAMPVEDSKEEGFLVDAVEEKRVLHVLPPALIRQLLPCISHVITRILPCWYLFIRFLVTGCERKAPPITLAPFIIKIIGGNKQPPITRHAFPLLN